MSIDLHCHSKISDGSMGLDELIITAKRRGVTALSITDHDAVAGATRAMILGRRHGIPVIHGVEFSAYDKTRNAKVHVLGYMCDAPDRLEGLCRNINSNRRAAATEMVKKVLRYYPIILDSITRCASGSTNIYKQHIMHALMDAGYADSIFGETYEKLFSPERGCAYVKCEYPDVRDVIDLIHSAGGLAVIAHAHAYHNQLLLEELASEKRIDGVEVWHPAHSAEDVEQLLDFADHHHLLSTGGSDFHGMYTRTPRPIGSCDAPDTTAAAMISYRTQKMRKGD